MKGLIRKDIYALKGTLVIVVVMFVLMTGAQVLADTEGSASMLPSFFMIFAAMLPFTSLSLDEHAKWPRYALTLRVTRAMLVLSKYIVGLFFIALSIAVTVIVNVALGAMEGFEMLLSGLCAITAFHAVAMPLMLRFGTEKARIVIILAAMGIAAFMVYQLQANSDAALDVGALLPYLFAGAAVLYGISILISLRIYRNKDFC